MTGNMNSDAGVTDPPANSDAQENGFPARLKTLLGKESARAFARRAGLSDTFLRQCLNGKSEPTRPMLIALASAGGVRLDWLASGEGPVRDDTESDYAKTNRELRPIEDVRIGHLPERLKKAIGTTSLRAVAEKSGLTEGTLRNLLNGGVPKLDSLLRIADATGVDASWLATGEERTRRSDAQQGIDRRAAALLGVLDALDQEQRDTILSDCLSRAQTAQQMKKLRQAIHDLEARLAQAS